MRDPQSLIEWLGWLIKLRSSYWWRGLAVGLVIGVVICVLERVGIIV